MKDRKNMIMVIVIGITISLFLCFNTTVFATTGTVTASDLRLRKENNTTSEIIDLLDENDEVEIISEDGDWYKVKAGGNVGYVNKQYIKVKESNVISNNTVKDEKSENENNISESNSSDEKNSSSKNNASENEESNTQQTETKQQATVLEESQIRVMPLINGDTINTVKSGQKYEVISIVGLWSYIKNGDITGWILTEKLSIETVNVNNETENKTVTEDNQTEENKNEQEEVVEKQEEQEEEQNENKEEQQEVQENKEDSSESETKYSSSKTYYVNGTSVNVRSEANKSSSVITKLTTNDEVTVTGETGDWYIVTTSGKKGYISKTLLSTKKTEVTSRSSNSLEQAQESTSNTETTCESSSSSGEAVVAYAKNFLGYPYVYGNNGPSSFDCSGFVQYVYKHFGYSLSHSSKVQATEGVAVSKSNLQPGDVLIFNNTSNTSIGHVGIYIGNNQFIHASNSKTGVIISSLSTSAYQKRYVGARRILK